MAVTAKRPVLRSLVEPHRHAVPQKDPERADVPSEPDPDKAYAELLQEVRVAQTGVQILLGFLMTFAFSPRFAALTELQAGQYVLTLLVAFGAAAFLTAPAPFHRVVFRCGMRTQLLRVSNRLALAGPVLLMLAMSSSLLLVVTMVLGIGRSAVLASVILGGVVWLWFGLPMWCRLRRTR
ncbi:membrane protein [Streptomyces lavendulae subsp. lavendulae]|nr:membrane protein [Streptomyces lavendulae subsp. lavendulae]